MKLYYYPLFLTYIFFIQQAVFAFSDKPKITKEPVWITKTPIDYKANTLDGEALDGYIEMDYQFQVDLASQSKYIHLSRKILSQAGVQNASKVSILYDPRYERLNLHSLHIIRNQKLLNRLVLPKFKVIHQENDLDNFIYNGTSNAFLILDDVRIGDIIEYSYTVTGFNPIFKNKYTEILSLNFSAPLYNLYYKIISPPERNLHIKNMNTSLKARISAKNGQKIYEWSNKNSVPLTLQDYTPSWYNPYYEVFISEYNNWKEVNDWAMELFPTNIMLSAELRKKIKEIDNTYKKKSEKLKYALRFVQDEIRYMGIEMGVNSHKPAHPSIVFAQRFGDCKEKSYLLCTMLNAMHINAQPVLINTELKSKLNDYLPSPKNFNHVTVKVILDNYTYWYDPTIAYQRGDVKELYYPDFQTGLVVAGNTTDLTGIFFSNFNSQQVKNYFKVGAMEGKGYLKVVSTYQGNAADRVRSSFNNKSNAELMNDYQKFYASYYEDIKADSLFFKDDEKSGLFTTTEYYTINNFWTLDKEGVNKFSFSAVIINDIIVKPKEKNRNMPFFLVYPAKYREETVIDLPQYWNVATSEVHLRSNKYTLNSRFYNTGNQVHLYTDYENYSDHVSADQAPEYFKDITEYESSARYELSLASNLANNSVRIEEKIAESETQDTKKSTFLKVFFVTIVLGGMYFWTKRH